MTTALDSIFYKFFEFWIWTNHNSLLSIATNQFASFCIDIRSRQCYFRVRQSGEIWNKKAFFSVYFNFLLYKTNRFHVAVRLFSNRSQRISKCGKNISGTRGAAECVTFLFLPHFDVICDLLLNRRTATWNLFVNQKVDGKRGAKVWGRNTLKPRRRGGRFPALGFALFYATPLKRWIWKNIPLASRVHFSQSFSVCSQRPRSSKCSCCIKLCCESSRFWTGPRCLQEWSVHQNITGELSLHLCDRHWFQFSSSRRPTVQEIGRYQGDWARLPALWIRVTFPRNCGAASMKQ